jgi:outer membrane cobalamin receptor
MSMVVASVMGRRRRKKEVGEKRKKAALQSKSGKDLVGKFEMDPEAKVSVRIPNHLSQL